MIYSMKNLTKKLDNLRFTQKSQLTNANTTQTTKNTKFFSRIKNLSNIKFNKEEKDILQLGLNYAIEKPTTRIIHNLVIDTENAIRQLHENEQKTP